VSLVPAEIHTSRLVIRSWRPDDAARLLPILEENRAHLGPWIPARVATPAPLPELSERLGGFAADFAADRSWRFAVLSPNGEDLFGEVDLLPRTEAVRVPYAECDRAEIGYWLRADVTGRGIATDASRAMIDVARTLPRISRLEIRCDARNSASAAVPRRLGFVLTSTLEDKGVSKEEVLVELQVWSLALEHAKNAARRSAVEAGGR
jgi:RimJ/RimL family protein N-acetyltransferase